MMVTASACAFGRCDDCREPVACSCECHGPRDLERTRRAAMQRRASDDTAAALIAAYERGPP